MARSSAAHILRRARLRRVQARARLAHDRADQIGDQLAHQFGAAPDVVERRIVPADLGDDVRRQRHHLEIIDGEQSGAQAVVDVMGVIGDVVGDGRDLRLERGKAPEFQIVVSDVIGDADGDAMLAVSADRRAAALGQRAVVLDDAFERFPGQVQAVEIGVAVFQRQSRPAASARCGRSRHAPSGRHPAPARRRGRTADGRGHGPAPASP